MTFDGSVAGYGCLYPADHIRVRQSLVEDTGIGRLSSDQKGTQLPHGLERNQIIGLMGELMLTFVASLTTEEADRINQTWQGLDSSLQWKLERSLSIISKSSQLRRNYLR
jgi:hypothetical protein